jgi:antitoxin (DNA-binding transcriptional repressor) of toxin-antitoxin stability system
MQINMYEAKTRLSELVQKALAGEEVIIAKGGKPMVTLKPVEAPRRTSSRGILAGQNIVIPEDFDEPMPDEWFEDTSGIE